VLQLRGLYAIYALNAFALVPHMVFLVDYVARGMGQGLDSGTHYWALFGIGAIIGPLLAGRLADRHGYRATLTVALLLELLFIGLPALLSGPIALIASSLVVGACTIGIVPVVLGRTREILRHHPAAQPHAWLTATASFALLQATGAYAFSFLLAWSGGDYRLLFGLGAAAIAMALALGIMTAGPATAPAQPGNSRRSK
jgi:predicted MFS family arabinose efflux permease